MLLQVWGLLYDPTEESSDEMGPVCSKSPSSSLDHGQNMVYSGDAGADTPATIDLPHS